MTKFEYLYRDRSNYKIYGKIILSGALSIVECDEIMDRLEGGEFFIAEQIGVPVLRDKLYEFSVGPTTEDHCWHEFVKIGSHCPSDGDIVWGTAQNFLRQFRSVKAWDLSMSCLSAL